MVKRVLGGEKELYEILVRHYNQLLYRVVRSYLDDENEVEGMSAAEAAGCLQISESNIKSQAASCPGDFKRRIIASDR